jgi:hypothetical protein
MRARPLASPPDLAAVPARAWLAFVLLALLGQAWVLANPGYFSHDELQWAWRADHAGWLERYGWPQWTHWQLFQWRPLTFHTWLALSDALFVRPWAYHAVFALAGIAVGAGLLRLLVRIGVRAPVATAFALVFVLGPYAMYTQGWVAALADLLWVGFGMAAANIVVALRGPPARLGAIAAAVAALTTLALLAKEAAIVLPALAALAWLTSGRRREWLVAFVASAVPTAIYLALRLQVILFTPRDGNYAWSVLSIPRQWLQYQVYPLAPSIFEAANSPPLATRHGIVALVLLAALWVAMWRADRRAATWWLLGGAAALGPVLLLEYASNQYGYGYSAVVAGALACAWDRLGPRARWLAAFLVAIGVWHGLAVARELHSVGARQARFSPQLAAVVERAGGATVYVRLPRDEDDSWIFRRLGHDLDGYANTPIGARAVILEHDDAHPADYVVRPDGSLLPAR